MSTEQTSNPENNRPESRRSSRFKIGLAVAIVVIIGGLGLAFATATGNPIVCTGCHEMDTAFQSWMDSPHSDVKCEDCHISPGILNMVRVKIRSEWLVEHARDPESGKVITTNVPDANCLSCHQNMPAVIEHADVQTTHQEHIDRSISCTYCHFNTGHINPDDTRPTGMALCTTCHDGRQATETCSLCHIKPVTQPAPAQHVNLTPEELAQVPHPEGFLYAHAKLATAQLADCQSCHTPASCESCHTGNLPPSHLQPDYAKNHKAEVDAGQLDCSTCHTQKSCLACHMTARPASHGPNWTRGHGGESAKPNATCNLCHTQQQCNTCHGLPMPHPPNFLAVHASESKAKPKVCERCHTQDYCQACHSTTRPRSHQAADFMDSGHGKLWAADPNNCSFCHTSPTYCDNCHTTQRPRSHTPQWLVAHGKAAVERQSNCAHCHAQDQCAACHGSGGVKPKNHVEGFLMKHADEARGNLAYCGMCHTANNCNVCHSVIGQPEIKF